MPDLPGALPASDLVRSSTPNAARIYDCLLGGKDNYQADRAAAAQLQEILPDVAKAARETVTSWSAWSATWSGRRASGRSSTSAPGCRHRTTCTRWRSG